MDSQESIWTHFCSSINKLVHCSYVNFAWKIFLHTFTKEVDHTFPAFSLLLLVVGGNIHLSVLCLFIQAVCNRKHCRLYGPAWLHCEALKGCLHIDLASPTNTRQQEESWGEEHANSNTASLSGAETLSIQTDIYGPVFSNSRASKPRGPNPQAVWSAC